MNQLRKSFLLILIIMLTGCGIGSNGGLPFFNPPNQLPSPVAQITPAPDAQAAITAYLEALKNDDFTSSLLNSQVKCDRLAAVLRVMEYANALPPALCQHLEIGRAHV